MPVAVGGITDSNSDYTVAACKHLHLHLDLDSKEFTNRIEADTMLDLAGDHKLVAAKILADFDEKIGHNYLYLYPDYCHDSDGCSGLTGSNFQYVHLCWHNATTRV